MSCPVGRPRRRLAVGKSLPVGLKPYLTGPRAESVTAAGVESVLIPRPWVGCGKLGGNERTGAHPPTCVEWAAVARAWTETTGRAKAPGEHRPSCQQAARGQERVKRMEYGENGTWGDKTRLESWRRTPPSPPLSPVRDTGRREGGESMHACFQPATAVGL